MASGVDRISALPDGVLEHVLGFLPADEAVQTSVLARRWRHLWRFMRRLRIKSDHQGRLGSVDGFNKFMSGLLLFRDTRVVLDEVNFTLCPMQIGGDTTYINIWVTHVLSCQAKVLAIQYFYGPPILLDGPPLVSRHLRKLELDGVQLDSNFLDFASCPALEVLEITWCHIYSQRISSQSIKHLLILDTCFLCEARTLINIPSLISTQLIISHGKAPLLETMPLLQTAHVVAYGFQEPDFCEKGDFWESCGICADCYGDDDHVGDCVLLVGLSSATNLKLIACPGRFIFRRDLRWCPTFSNLKTLFLNEWCVANDLGPLFCILKNSPVLEKLTLQLAKGYNHTIQMDAIYHLMENSDAISKHLKIDVQCEVVDDRVCNILNLLMRLDIKITLKRTKENWLKLISFERQ